MNLGNLLQEVSYLLALAGHLKLLNEKSKMGWAERMFFALRFPGVNAWASGKTARDPNRR
ncbi:MAG: hypothetical protein AUJ04_09260 [Acidobacteria bacterium 13_1_40CM_3_55_6]|nr:MAG: hypothetical protein AUJ04_09260 [Acidobacteria bacterium 13_1_40CM_3_55_6]